MRVVRHDARTPFEKAWSRGIASGLIDSEVSESITKDGTRAIRKIALILGSEYLRADLERAMRSMLGLVNLHLAYESGGDVDKAAQSLASKGLLHHTKGASRIFKKMGCDEREIVTQSAFMSYADFVAAIADHERHERTYAAARWALQSIGYPDDLDKDESPAAICTAMLFMIYKKRGKAPAWNGDMAGLEAVLSALRAKPKALDRLPATLPDAYRPEIEWVWRSCRESFLKHVVCSQTPIHQLVGASVESGSLIGLLMKPCAGIGDIDGAAGSTTAHWRKLTGGLLDEDTLMSLMLSGLLCAKARPKLTSQEVKAIAGQLLEQPAGSRLDAWLDENVPHDFHGGMRELWAAFWGEVDAVRTDSEAGRVKLIKAWTAKR